MIQCMAPPCPKCGAPMGRNVIVDKVVCFYCDLTYEQRITTWDYYYRQQMAGAELLAVNPFDRD